MEPNNTISGIYVPELNAIRVILMLFVLLHHMLIFQGGGALAVSFFFVLGGFSLTMGYAHKIRNEKFQYKTFIWKRFVKFYPLHWLCLCLFCILHLLCSLPIEIVTFVPNFFLIQSFIPVRDFFYSYNSPSWYLCNTLFYAILFPFIINRLLYCSIRCKILYAIELLVLYTVICILIPEKYWLSILYINPFVRLLDFIFGILLALVVMDILNNNVSKYKILKSNIATYIIAIALIALLVVISSQDEMVLLGVVYLIPEALLLLILTLKSFKYRGLSILRTSVVKYLGSLSFTFYMLHSFFINIVNVLCGKLYPNQNLLIQRTAFVLIITLCASIIIQRYFEKPINKIFNS